MSLRLLIIDDEPEICALVAEVAHDIGYDAHQAQDADAVYRELVTFSPDVIILDLMMPGMDGVEWLRVLANKVRSAKVCLISGSDLRVLNSARRLGSAHGLDVFGVFEKPIDIKQLRAALMELSGGPVEAGVQGKDIADALAAGQITMHYQPVISMADRRVFGAEALMRWQHSTRGLLFPGDFLDKAIQDGMLQPLTHYALKHAIGAAAEWEKAGLPLTVAINLTASCLLDLTLPEQISDMCAQVKLPAERVLLEVTETEAMKDAKRTMDVLLRMRLRGIGLGIDDFGTGFSSLRELQRMPFSEMKIDRSFVMDMAGNKDRGRGRGGRARLGHAGRERLRHGAGASYGQGDAGGADCALGARLAERGVARSVFLRLLRFRLKAEHLVIAALLLPVGLDRDIEKQVDLAVKEGFKRAAGRDAQLLELRAALADDDGFLTVAHDDDFLFDAGAAVGALLPAGGEDGGGIGQFLPQLVIELLARDFGGDERGRHIGQVVGGEDPVLHRHVAGKVFFDILHAVAGFGGDHEGFLENVFGGQLLRDGEDFHLGELIDLVEDEDGPALLLLQLLHDLAGLVVIAAGGIDDEQDDIGIDQALPGGADHGAVKAAARGEDARRVEQADLAFPVGEDAEDAGARGLRLGAGDGQFVAQQAVEQGGFARVGRADDGGEAAIGSGGSDHVAMSLSNEAVSRAAARFSASRLEAPSACAGGWPCTVTSMMNLGACGGPSRLTTL